MNERIGIPLRTINLFVLHKQSLLDSSPRESLLQIAENLIGLHAKRPQTAYLSLRARIPGFSISQLDELIYTRRELLRSHCMRGTVHLLPLSIYNTVLAVTLGQLDAMYLRAFKNLEEKVEIQNDIVSLIERFGAQTSAKIFCRLQRKVDKRTLHLLINELCTRGILIKAAVNGTWRSSLYQYALLSYWQPNIPSGETEPTKAQARLIHWYLKTYGPATLSDLVWWSGLCKTKIKQALDYLNPDWKFIYFDGLQEEAFILEDDLEFLNSWSPPLYHHVSFLPAFDSYIMAYAERKRFIDPKHYKKVFRGISGLINPVILINGYIMGIWDYGLVDNQLVYRLFDIAAEQTFRRELDYVATQVASFLQNTG